MATATSQPLGQPGPPPEALVRPPLASRPWMIPACWAVAAMSVPIMAVWLWGVSWPGGLGLLQIGLGLMALAAGLCWAALLAIHLVARRRNRSAQHGSAPSSPARGTVALALTGLLWSLTAGLTMTDAPLRARFEMSRSAFEAAALEGDRARVAATERELVEVERGFDDALAMLDSDGPLGRYPSGRIFVYPERISVEPHGPLYSFGWFEHLPDGVSPWWEHWGSGDSPRRLSLGDGWWAVWYPIPT